MNLEKTDVNGFSSFFDFNPLLPFFSYSALSADKEPQDRPQVAGRRAT